MQLGTWSHLDMKPHTHTLNAPLGRGECTQDLPSKGVKEAQTGMGKPEWHGQVGG